MTFGEVFVHFDPMAFLALHVVLAGVPAVVAAARYLRRWF